MENINSIIKKLPKGVYLGIDPGENGAIAYVAPVLEDGWSVDYFKTEGVQGYKELVNINSLVKGAFVKKVFMERERVSPLMGPAAATTFMTGYGFGLGVLHCMGIEPVLYDPQVWQRILKLNSFDANGDKKLKKKHYETQIRALWGDNVAAVPTFAIDAYGILLAGLISL